MKKAIQVLRNLISRVHLDVKDHLLVIFAYFFTVVQWGLSISQTAAYYTIAVGFLGAVSWELLTPKFSDTKLNIRESAKDLIVYILFAALYIVALKYQVK